MQGLLQNHLEQRRSNILASFGIDLQKANGEGSRGGKVIGHTKSGKPVYARKIGKDQIYQHFSKEDHADAKKIHEDEADEHQKKIPEYAFASKTKHGSMKQRDWHKQRAYEHDMEHSRLKRQGESTNDSLKKGGVGSGPRQKFTTSPNVTHKKLKQHLKDDEEHFYNVVSQHYQPSDDGESEHTMLQNLSKHKHIDKILSKLDKKPKK